MSTPDIIYLIPNTDGGTFGYMWCDDPAPELGMEPEDAVKYVKASALNDARIESLEKLLFDYEEYSGGRIPVESIRYRIAELKGD